MAFFEKYGALLLIWLAVSVWVAVVILTNRKVHPWALFMLFLVELWERFSYYGMRALLVLYLSAETMRSGFGFEKKAAVGIYAAYGALVYLTPLAGGFLADRLLGFRKAIIWGAILMGCGQFALSASGFLQDPAEAVASVVVAPAGGEKPADTQPAEGEKPAEAKAVKMETKSLPRTLLLYAGLSLLVIGNGFFKPNISSLIGRFYPQGDPRRDGAFTIFYMGINIGAFLTPLTCGKIGQTEGWQWGFLCAGVGMAVGLLIFLYTVRAGYLEQHADPPPASTGGSKIPPVAVYAASLLTLPLFGLLIRFNDAMDYLLVVVGTAAIGYMLYLSFRYPTVERQRIWVIVVLLVFTAIFWTFFELAGSALNLFTESNVNRTILQIGSFTWTPEASEFQAANAFFIMAFAPVFSYLWLALAKKNLEPSAPVKFAAGLLLLGAGFVVLNLGKGFAVDFMVPAVWLILLYLLHTLGELALSPVGLSLVTKLAPARIVGFMMGFWFLSSAFAHQAGKWIAREAVAAENATKEQTLNQAIEVFNVVGLTAFGSGLLLLLLSPLIKKWMHGVK